MTVAPAGFLTGGAVGKDGVDASRGMRCAAAFVLPALTAAAVAWWSARRRAARFGLSASRFSRVARQTQRGEVPADPAERQAPIDVATRQRRTLNVQEHRWVWWMTGGIALPWLRTAVLQVPVHNCLYAGVSVLLIGVFLINPLATRRQRRRLEAVERALDLPPALPGHVRRLANPSPLIETGAPGHMHLT